mgnify:CR=1 FL=1|jgi:hypothetical protein
MNAQVKNKVFVVFLTILIFIAAFLFYKHISYKKKMNIHEKVIMHELNIKLTRIILYLTQKHNIKYIEFDIYKAPKNRSSYVTFFKYIYIDPYKKNTNIFYNDDTLFYVVLHELTHIILKQRICKNSLRFKNMFLNLYHIAIKLKMLDHNKIEKYHTDDNA